MTERKRPYIEPFCISCGDCNGLLLFRDSGRSRVRIMRCNSCDVNWVIAMPVLDAQLGFANKLGGDKVQPSFKENVDTLAEMIDRAAEDLNETNE